MGFGDLKSPDGLQVLSDYLADNCYIKLDTGSHL
jgi:hypothetical protein